VNVILPPVFNNPLNNRCKSLQILRANLIMGITGYPNSRKACPELAEWGREEPRLSRRSAATTKVKRSRKKNKNYIIIYLILLSYLFFHRACPASFLQILAFCSALLIQHMFCSLLPNCYLLTLTNLPCFLN
jgi:hypothetical protein